MKTIYRVPVRWLILVAMIFQALGLSAQWTTASLSVARYRLAATSAGGKVFFAGGGTEYQSITGGIAIASNVVDIYDTATNTWSTAALSVARYDLAATSAGSKVFFAGGDTGSGPSDRVDIYDTATNTWSTATLSQPRSHLAAASAGGKVFFAGGGSSFNDAVSNRVDIYDTANDTWSISTLSHARWHLAATSAGGKVYFEGGQTFDTFSNVTDIYDTATNTWSVNNFHVARTDLAAASAGGKVYFGGGRNQLPRIEVRVFDTNTNTSSGAILSARRHRLAATNLETIVIFAGGEETAGPEVGNPRRQVDIFSIYSSSSFASSTNLSQARSYLAAASSGGKAFFAGGLTQVGSSNTPSDRVDIYTANPTFITQQPGPASQNVCQGNSASTTVAASGTNLDYAWFRNNPNTTQPASGQTSATLSLNNVQPSDAGTYYCRVIGYGGVAWSTPFTLSVTPAPTASNGTATACSGTALNVDLQARITNSEASNFTWTVANNPDVTGATSGSGDFITQTLSATSLQTVTYTVTPSSATGACAGAAFSVTVTVTPGATASAITLGDNLVCQAIPSQSSTVAVQATFGGAATSGSFSDSGIGGTFSLVTDGNLVAGNYYPPLNYTGPVTITFSTNDPAGDCPAASSTAPLTVQEAATASPITAGAPAICQNATTTFSASWGGSATFGGFTDGGVGGTFTTLSQVGNGISVSYKPPLNFTGPITIYFLTTNPDGPCSYATTTTTLTVNSGATASAITLGDNGLVCQALPIQSSTVAVQATFGGAATSGSFSDGGIGGTFSLVTDGNLVAGNYYPPLNYTGPVTITFSTNDPAGDCPATSSTAPLTVQEAATASPITAGAPAICQNATTTFSASWGGSATFGGFTDGGVGGTFTTLSQVGNGISVSYKPPLNFTGPITIYFLTTNPDGPCSYATTTTTLTVNSGATASAITLGDNLVCQAIPSQSSTVAVQATFGGAATSGSFSDGGINGTFSLVTDGTLVAGNYYPPLNYTGPVTITFSTNDPAGDCPAASSTAHLTVQEAATASPITAGAPAICQNATTAFSASWGGSATFGGFTDGGVGGTFTTLSQVGNGISVSYKPPLNFTGLITIYFLTTNPDGPCSYATTTTSLTVNSTPTPAVIANGPTTFCTGGSVVLSTSSFSSYSWKKDGNPVSTDPTYTATTSGSYTVTVTNGGSCSGASDPVIVTVNPIPAPVITPGGSTILCAGGSVTLSAGTFDSYVWKKDNVQVSTDPTYTATTGGNYTVTVTASGCTGTSASTTLTVTPLLFSSAASLPTGPFCAGQVVSLSFGANACLSTNSFTAQLSNASGNFSTPTATWSVSPGNNSIRLPLSADLGAGYAIRVVASPSGLSSTTGAFAVTGRPTLGTPAVNGAPICAGQVVTLNLPVECTLGFGLTNTFTPQLSDLNGNFSNPVNLEAVSPGSNALRIPATTGGGTGYRIRVVSSDPALTSAVSNAFEVKVYAFNSTATVSQVPVCAGSTFTVSFTLTINCPSGGGAAFAGELSDASGSFAAPVSLGAIQQGINSGILIPPSTPAGSGYRVRVVVPGNPALTSTPSSAFQVRVPGFSSTPSVSGANKCPGEAVRLSFTAGGSGCVFFPGNVFTAQLSNASGSFAAAVPLGTVASGISNVVIPLGTPAGNGYKIRVVSSSPEVVSSGSSNFSVKACGTTREIAPEDRGLRVSVSPNPSPEGRLRITIAGAEGQELKVELFSGTGRSLRQQRVERAAEVEVLEWDIARQPQGLYLLRVSGARETRTVKVLH